jgi:hypothetical protein
MRLSRRWITAAVLIGLSGAACARSDAGEAETPGPVTVTAIEGTDVARVTLTADAVRRLDVRTDAVRPVHGGDRTTIPYAAVLYDADGATWAYTNPEPLVFVRAAVEVDRIVGRRAVLRDGPAAGTLVVTVGAAELLGSEYEVGEE